MAPLPPLETRTFQRPVLLFAAALLAFQAWVICPTAYAALHVDQSSKIGACDDARSADVATTASTPWCSLERAIAASPASAVIEVHGGNYPELVLANDRRRGAMLTIRAAPGDQPVLSGLRATGSDWLHLEGFRIIGEVAIGADCAHWRIIGNEIDSPEERSVGVGIGAGSTDILVAGNRIHVPHGTGVNFSSDYSRPEISDVVLRQNLFDGIGIDAMQIKNYRRVLIEDNEVTGVYRYVSSGHSDVIQSVYGGSSLTIKDNYFHDNDAGIIIKDGRVDDLRIENNVIVRMGFQHALNIWNADARITGNTLDSAGNGVTFQASQPGIAGTSSITLVNNILPNVKVGDPSLQLHQDYNLIGYAAHVRGAHDVAGKPTYAEPSADFRLADLSLGIDAGTSDYATAVDRRGRPRADDPDVANSGGGSSPFVDMGAYERQFPPTPIPPPLVVPALQPTVASIPRSISVHSVANACDTPAPTRIESADGATQQQVGVAPTALWVAVQTGCHCYEEWSAWQICPSLAPPT